MAERGAAIVTGSAQGIGEAIARRLADEGYRICVNDVARNASKVEAVVADIRKQHGHGSATGVIADVTKLEEVQAMINSTVNDLASDLTLMVANAGVCQIKGALDLTPEDVKFVFDVNFLGTFNCYTLSAKQMISQNEKALQATASLDESKSAPTPGWKHRIIGASSIVAFRSFPLSSHYSAAKWAVRGFTQAFAIEMAPHRIAVNAYAPGIVATDMWNQIDEGLQGIAGMSHGEASQEGAQRALMQRLATPRDVANVVAGFLAGPDAGYINGQTIVIDGGTILT